MSDLIILIMRTAVILAGGLGTRLRPLTYELPKSLIPVQGITLTEQVIAKAKEAGIEKFYLSIGYLSEQIVDYFSSKDFGVKIDYIIEDTPLGTGGWLNKLSAQQIKDDFSDDFLVLNGDNLFDLDWTKMKIVHDSNNSLITIALTQVEDVTAFGVADLDGAVIKRFVEKPTLKDAPSNYINSGYYIFSPKVFDIVPNEEKFSMERVLFPKAAEMGLLFGYPDSSQWFDTGTFVRWEKVIFEWRK